jgi:RNA polymerase sigma-70 factor (ECF subfamily)
MDGFDENELVVQARDNPDAFGKLYERYVDRIFAFAYLRTHDEALARDITSATFEKALRHLHRYQWRGISFGAWLYRIARNEIAQHYRRIFLPLPDHHPANFDTERIVQTNEQHDSLYKALKRLSRTDQELVAMRFFDDLSSAEIAEILGCSVDNVYRRLYRALSRLRKQLEQIESSEVMYAQE